MKRCLFTAALALTLSGAGMAQNTNPFLSESYGTPYEIAPFEKITIDNYREAYLKGMEEQKQEINAIIRNRAVPDFENTIVALDQSGKLLSKVQSTFGPISSSNSTEETRALQKELSPLLSAHNDDIYLNPQLFAKVKEVYDNQQKFGLNKEQTKLLKNVYNRFIRGGAGLNDEQKEELRKLNTEISMLQLTFSQNLMHETNNTSLPAHWMNLQAITDIITVINWKIWKDFLKQTSKPQLKWRKKTDKKANGCSTCSALAAIRYCNIARTANCAIVSTMHTTTEATRTMNTTTRKLPASWLPCACRKPN